jgi:hypothetical protein
MDVDGAEGFDELKELTDKYGELPPTRMVKSGRVDGGTHYYWDATGLEIRTGKLTPHIDLKGNTINAVIVAPPSIHESGTAYSYISRCAPVRAPEWLEGLVRSERSKQPARDPTQIPGSSLASDYGLPTCMMIAPPINAQQKGDNVQGEHPFHGTTTGKEKSTNFTIDTKKDVWHCFAHHTGGGALELYAVGKGIVQCEDIQPGWLKKHYRAVMEALKEDGYESKRRQEEIRHGKELAKAIMRKYLGGE